MLAPFHRFAVSPLRSPSCNFVEKYFSALYRTVLVVRWRSLADNFMKLNNYPIQFALFFLVVTTAAQPPKARLENGFKYIFNGKDLTNWEGDPKHWSVADGALTGVTDGTLKVNSFIIWRGGTLKNFERRVRAAVINSRAGGF